MTIEQNRAMSSKKPWPQPGKTKKQAHCEDHEQMKNLRFERPNKGRLNEAKIS